MSSQNQQPVKQQLEQQSSFSVFSHLQKFLVSIPLAVVLILLTVVAVGAFFIGRTTVQNSTTVIPTLIPTAIPTAIPPEVLQSTPTSQPQPTGIQLTPGQTNISCNTDADCPRQYASTGYICQDGKCVMEDKHIQICPSGTVKVCEAGICECLEPNPKQTNCIGIAKANWQCPEDKWIILQENQKCCGSLGPPNTVCCWE